MIVALVNIGAFWVVVTAVIVLNVLSHKYLY